MAKRLVSVREQELIALRLLIIDQAWEVVCQGDSSSSLIYVHGRYSGVAGAYLGLLFFMKDSSLPSTVDLTFWLLTTLVDGFVVYLFVLQGLFRRFLFLSLYFLLSVAISIARCVILLQFGLSSVEYAYSYYVTDALLTGSLFLALSELCLRVSKIGMLRWKIVTWAGSILLMMACFGVESLTNNGARMFSLLLESSQNAFLMCGFAVVLLWVWKRFRIPADGVSARLVNVFGVYFLLSFLVYGGRNFAGPSAVAGLGNLSSMAGAWLPLGCGFALVSQEQTLRL